MAESKYENVWNLLSNHTFVINENDSENVSCMICKRLMIDPYIGPCGCRYCYRCIRESICEEKKHCPGNKVECSEENLEMEKNVLRDLFIRRRIVNLVVKCTNDSCSFREKLENIEEHIRICAMKPAECPYETVGCLNNGLKENNLKFHMDQDVVKHSQLLFEAINCLRNELTKLNQIMAAKEIEINKLKKKTEKNKTVIEKIKEDNQRKEVQLKSLIQEKDDRRTRENDVLKNYNIRIKQELEVLKADIVQIKQKEKNDLKEKEEKQKEHLEDESIKEILIKKLKDSIDEMKKEIIILKDNEIRRECQNKEIQEHIKYGELRTKTELEMMNKSIINLKENMIKKHHEKHFHVENELQNCTKERKSLKDAIIKEFGLDVEEKFVWKIENFEEKSKNTFLSLWHASDSFYINDYKLCLRAYIDGYLYLYVIIMKGERDEIAQWPMKHTITISITNHVSLKIHKFWKLNYDECKDKSLFNKPKTCMNEQMYCGCISLGDIKDVNGLLSNDSVIIGCSLSLN